MPSVPLPFIVAVVLLILLATLAKRDGLTPANGPLLLLIGACSVQSVLLGLRWGYAIEPVRHVLPILAAALPPLVYASFRTLTTRTGTWRLAMVWPHLVPVLAVALLVAAWPWAIDLALILIYLGYASVLFWLGRSGPDVLRQARFEGTVPAHLALLVSAATLAASAIVDGLVALDFEWMHGTHAGAIIAVANLTGLLAFGLVAIVVGRSQTLAESPETAKEATGAIATDEDREVVARIEGLMQSERLYRDENLNLNRLARKAGIPARQISAAVNRIAARNVSQYVNDYRIAAACRLIADTDQPITTIMFEAGFQTKSNFNREFRRVMGMSPSAWRAHQKASTQRSQSSR